MPALVRQSVFCISLVCALFLAASIAMAQSNTGPDYTQWQTIAQRAERAIDADRASDSAFEAVRAEIARYRQEFLNARQSNTNRIDTLQSQLNALGELPEDGNEPPEISSRRLELLAQLQDTRAPILKAEEAYNQADGLIREIDRILDERRADDLLKRGPTPLNPVLWPEAFENLGVAIGAIGQEIRRAISDDENREEIQSNLLVFLLLFTLGTVLIARGRRWALRMVDFLRSIGGAGTGVWSFVFSLGRIILPVLGVYFISEAIFVSGVLGVRGARLVENLPEWGAVLLVLRWLCERLFSRNEEDALIPFSRERRSELRFYGTLLAVIYVSNDFIWTLMQIANGSETDQAVAGFPILLLCALILFRMGQILNKGLATENADGEGTVDRTGYSRILQVFGKTSIAVAISAPVISALGYTTLAPEILYPTIQSLALFGLILVIQRFFADIYAWLSGRGIEARDSLIPVLIGFLLAIAIIPLLALIWGARSVEILEVWQMFNDGIAIGETRISPTNFLTFAVIFGGLFMLTRLLQSALKTSLLPKTRMDTGGQNAVVSGVGYLGVFLAALAAITGAGIDLSGLAIVAGALSVGIGFGLQTIVQNFVSGIILLIERPIAEGDWIEVNGNMGYVRDISVRSTRIETFDRTDVIVPNADFVSGTVTNYTRGNTIGRVIAPVGVAYGTDTRKVETILREIAENHPMVLATPPPNIVFQGFGADSLDFEIRAILRDVNWVLSVKSDLNHAIAKRFAEEGIEIPFAQRDVWLRNPETLTRGDKDEEPEP